MQPATDLFNDNWFNDQLS